MQSTTKGRKTGPEIDVSLEVRSPVSSIAARSVRRRRLTPEARREEILNSATELISSVGFNSTTVDDFARAAGISRPGLLHHFSSKEALLGEVLNRRDDQDIATGEDRYPSVSTPTEARRVITDLVRVNLERPEMVRMYTMLSAEALVADHPAHEYFRQRGLRAREYFAAHLLSWHDSPDTAAIQLGAFLDGLQATWLRDPSVDVLSVWEGFAGLFFLLAEHNDAPPGEPAAR